MRSNYRRPSQEYGGGSPRNFGAAGGQPGFGGDGRRPSLGMMGPGSPQGMMPSAPPTINGIKVVPASNSGVGPPEHMKSKGLAMDSGQQHTFSSPFDFSQGGDRRDQYSGVAWSGGAACSGPPPQASSGWCGGGGGGNLQVTVVEISGPSMVNTSQAQWSQPPQSMSNTYNAGSNSMQQQVGLVAPGSYSQQVVSQASPWPQSGYQSGNAGWNAQGGSGWNAGYQAGNAYNAGYQAAMSSQAGYGSQAPPQSQGSLDLEGWLGMREEIGKGWKTKWLTLRNGCLSTSKVEKGPEDDRLMIGPMTKVRALQDPRCTAEGKVLAFKKKWGFEVVSGPKPWFMDAGGMEKRDLWMARIQAMAQMSGGQQGGKGGW